MMTVIVELYVYVPDRITPICIYLIEQSQVKTLCEKAKEILSKESNVQEVRFSEQVSSP